MLNHNYDLEKLTSREKEILLKKCPESSLFYQLSESQIEYFSGLKMNQPHQIILKRSNIFLSIFYKKIQALFNQKIAEESTQQLQNNFLVSTAEHLGMISHPECLNTVLNQFIYRINHSEKYLISLACSTVKMSNELDSRFCYFGEDKFSLVPSKY